MKLSVICTILLLVPSICEGQSKWKIPQAYQGMKNPVTVNDAAMKEGMTLYRKHCEYCHGRYGQGDGGKSRALKTSPKDLSAAKFQNLTPGEQFYSSKTGRGEMPDYTRKLTDTEVWQIVIYMKSFRKGKY